MKWVSVKDRLPIVETDEFDHYKDVIVIVYDGIEVFATEFRAGRSTGFWCEFEDFNITHWMPLPGRPKDEV